MDYAACLCTLNLMREGQGQEEMFPSLLDQPPQSLVDSHLLRRVPIEMEHSLEVVLYDPDSLHVVSFVWHWDLCPSGCISRAVQQKKSTHTLKKLIKSLCFQSFL